MLRRIRDRFQFAVERMILQSPIHRLLVIAVAIVSISFAAGLVVFELGHAFVRFPDAVWWAFLRLTDPGYLGDDQGRLLRVVSTVVTILGYVVFLGALIAIMTQWLQSTITRLQQGLTPIARLNHVVILGWTNRTPTIVQELLLSEERVRRFLRSRGSRTLSIALLVEDLGPEIVQELRDRLGTLWSYRQIIFRSGSPLRLEHLDRVDFCNAAAILLPFPEFVQDNAFARDERTIKVLLSIDGAVRRKNPHAMPLVVVEMLDARNTSLARRAYSGPIEILASDLLISRLIAQNVRHAGISGVYSELLTHSEGNEIYVRNAGELAGRTIGELRNAFPDAILLGVSRNRGSESLLDPPHDLQVEPGDRFVLIARNYEESAPDRNAAPAPAPRSERPVPPIALEPLRRILVLGWNHKVPALVAEFATYRGERFELDIASLVDVNERELLFRRYGVEPAQGTVRHIEADYTSLSDLTSLQPAQYDNVVILASEWKETDVESDARTILGFLILEEILAPASRRPEVLVELMDQENVPLLRGRADVLISPLVLSHMLTQVALRRELRAVFDDMFGPGGVELFLRPALDFGEAGERLTFHDLFERIFAAGDIALGLRRADGTLALNPAKSSTWTIADGDEVIVLMDTGAL